MKNFLENFKIWFYASRGYTLPMSVFSFLVVFVWCVKQGGNIPYGILAFIGIAVLHLATNLFDDFLDLKNNVPKQEAKRKYINNGKINLKQLGIATSISFIIPFLIGLFFFIKFGFVIFALCVVSGLLCLLYPKLNHVSLGEASLILTFGPLMFFGVCTVMECDFDFYVFLLSILVGVITMLLLEAHAFMDFDSDVKSNKKTLMVLMKDKSTALRLLFSFVFLTYLLMAILVIKDRLSYFALLFILIIPFFKKLYNYLKDYIKEDSNKNFMRNFVLTRNLCVLQEIILIISIIFN